MAVSGLIARLLPRFLLKFAERLRFPHLFLLMLGLFVVDFLIPDPIPFFDEIFLGLATLLLASWKNRRPRP
jgi:hypothetical protein